MTGLLQRFDFRSSRYERPAQNWLCGHAAAGNSCRIGPDHRGRCRAAHECQPRLDKERWICTRSASEGGKCPQGALPDGTCCRPISKCVPTRSLRGKRSRTVIWAIVMTVGLLILAQVGSYATQLISPGAVTLHHGEIGACSTCHNTFGDGPTGWIHAAFAPSDPTMDSKKCLACHELGNDAFRPHSLASGTLAELTRASETNVNAAPRPFGLNAARSFFGTPTQVDEALGCATCHKEHQGRRFDQTEMTNGRCQSCHNVQFASLASGHPGFGAYPFTRRTRINFDHVSHFKRHFEKAGPDKAPGTCTDCHSPAPDSRLMMVDGFAKTCAACHLEQIEGVDRLGAKGIAFLALPGLDLETLGERGTAIGEWPELSEESLTPFMKLLLAQNATFAADLDRIESIDDLLDLSDSSDEDIEAIQRLVWSVKELIYTLTVSGVMEMKESLAEALGQDVDHAAMGRLFGVVPSDVIRSAQAAWFPNLAEELARNRRGEQVLIPGTAETEDAVAESADEGGAQESVDTGEGDILSGDEGDILSGDEGDILSGDEDDILSGDEGDILSGDEGDILSEDEGDILSGDEGDILSEDEGDILSGDEGDILSGDEGDILSEGDALSEEDGADPAATDDNEVAAAMPEPDAELWAALGGWYRREFVLYYKPLGHGDRFVQTWLDFSGQTFGTPQQPAGATLFNALADERSPGRCTKCHSIDRDAGGAMNAKWNARKPQPETKTATVFSHGTHFSMLHEDGCLTCHTVAAAANFAEGYKDSDPLTFASNFAPIDRATCATCHLEERAGDSCLLCHRYHIGTFTTRPVLTQMQ